MHEIEEVSPIYEQPQLVKPAALIETQSYGVICFSLLRKSLTTI